MFTLRGTILPRSPLPTHASSVEKLLMARRDVWEVRELATPNALGSAPNPTTTCEDMTSDLPSFGNTGGVKAAQSYACTFSFRSQWCGFADGDFICAAGPMTDFQRLVRRNKNELVTDHQATQHNTLGATRIAQVKINGNYKDIAIDIRPKASGREDDALYGQSYRLLSRAIVRSRSDDVQRRQDESTGTNRSRPFSPRSISTANRKDERFTQSRIDYSVTENSLERKDFPTVSNSRA